MPDPTPAPDRPVRDQHGTPIPGTGAADQAPELGPAQIDEALDGLPGWQRQGATQVREFAVEPDSLQALREGVEKAAGGECGLSLEEQPDGVVIRIGAGTGNLTADHLEAAARVDRVLSGSAPT
jgi:hypothetical protein